MSTLTTTTTDFEWMLTRVLAKITTLVKVFDEDDDNDDDEEEEDDDEVAGQDYKN